ncbi:tryptophan 2,3-dioxygenase family protein [Brumimicrobium sp.]|uniref:tryptophan 2,3-dioxygenase family protein n=1 Tax=Brumimicrobium sp. TaxID=2029867 RepID=UPI00262D225B|nr:tryptophan 2,3-dioxygenase family protein [uncultured Brumimicrobium sp.]
MKKIPYNLYIYFEELSSLFIENTNSLRTGFASVELSSYLLGSFLKKKEALNTVKIAHILKGIEMQFELLNSCSFSEDHKGFKDGYSENIEYLKLLDKNHARTIDRISTSYFDLSKKIKLGLDEQFHDLRAHFNLSKLTHQPCESKDLIDYPNVVRLLQLNELNHFNSEDELFMIVHQISELWFNIGINEIKVIDRFLEEPENKGVEIEQHFNAVYDVLMYLADHVLLLEHMVLADYHPLRVALRGASGGQSQQAYMLFGLSKKLFEKFLKVVENKNNSIVQILEFPYENKVLLPIVNHFTTFERALKNFFFQHYVLTSSIIGAESFGSIGHDLISLVGKFIQPIFKEIDQAKYDLTLKTNYQYSKQAGVLIMEKENFIPQSNQKHTENHQILETTIDNYFLTISQLDQEGWIDLFDENGYIEDPVGSRPYVGHDQLAIFFKGVVRFFKNLTMTMESIEIEKDFVNVYWKAEGTSYNDKSIKYQGVEIFQINDQGKILCAKVEWDPSIVAEQL